MVKLVVGLGNPGEQYRDTRHNLGFLLVERLAKQYHIAIERKICDALVGETLCNNMRVLMVKPQTFMNRSGAVVKGLLDEFGGTASDLVIVYDDLDLPFGRIRIRTHGSAGGHRGVLSIAESLANELFCRVRLGIGRPPEGKAAVDYVLEPFSADESRLLSEHIEHAAAAVDCLLCDGAQRAMEVFNRAQ